MNASSRNLSSNSIPRLNLVRQRNKVWCISAIAIALAIAGLVFSSFNPSIGTPLKLGLDFTGGTQIKLDRECNSKCQPIDTSIISDSLSNITFNNDGKLSTRNLSEVKVKFLDGSQTLVLRLPFLSASEGQKVINATNKIAGPFKNGGQSIDTIGPTLGIQLLKSSLISLFFAFAGISLYISFRYDKIYSLLALIALAHDVVIVCGIFAWLGVLFSVEVDSLFAVSLLTIAGYSVNDTVVVFDRIRSQLREKSSRTFADKIDYAVSSTLTRTLYTSGTTLLPLVSLIFFGGSTLFWFSISLSLGVIVGSWSSIALAPSLLSLREKSQKIMIESTKLEE